MHLSGKVHRQEVAEVEFKPRSANAGDGSLNFFLCAEFEFTFIWCYVTLSYLYLLRTGYVPGPVARPGDTAETKRDRSTLMELSDHREQVAHQCHPGRIIPSSQVH